MRYLIQLLPHPDHAEILQQLRLNIADIVGLNRALDYAIPHITILSSIQDVDKQIIDQSSFIKQFNHFSCSQLPDTISCQTSLIDRPDVHVSLDVQPGDMLQLLTSELHHHLQSIFNQAGSKVAQAVKPESWFHITLAQNIDQDKQFQARQAFRQSIANLPQAVLFDRLALWTKDPQANQHYQLISSLSLSQISGQ